MPKLTRRKHEVLEAIAEELTTKEILDKSFINVKKMGTHRMNLMSKLRARNSVRVIKKCP